MKNKPYWKWTCDKKITNHIGKQDVGIVESGNCSWWPEIMKENERDIEINTFKRQEEQKVETENKARTEQYKKQIGMFGKY